MRSGYVRGAGFVAFITMLYPIAWGCSEGGNVISLTGEMIWYGILDLLLGPVFLFIFLWGLRSVDYGAFGLASGKYTDAAYGGAGAAYGTGPNMAARNGAATGAGVNGAGVGTGPAVGTAPATGAGTTAV